LVGPLAAFNEVVRQSRLEKHELWLGRNCLGGIEGFLRVFKLVRGERTPPSLETYQDMITTGPYSTQNTYSYLRYFWDDYGWLGILIGPLIFGWLSTLIWYHALLPNASISHLALSLLWSACIPTSLMMLDQWNWYILVPLCVLTILLNKRVARPGRLSERRRLR
jgi:hypothetical protein